MQGWPVLVKNTDCIWRQGLPPSLMHLSLQLSRGSAKVSGKRSEGLGQFGLRKDAFQDVRCTSHIDLIENRSSIRRLPLPAPVAM
jgi:hypothetical protein